MARGGIVQSSVPEAALEEGLIDEEIATDDPELEAAKNRITELESRARRMGWRPLEEYRGTTPWVDAATFIARGDDHMPFVKKELSRTKEELEGTRHEVDGLRQLATQQGEQLKQILEYSRRADQAGYNRAVADLKAKQRDAAASGDITSFDQIAGQLDQMQEARDESREAPTPAPAPAPNPQPRAQMRPQGEYQEFLDANPWFNRDAVLNTGMIAEHNRIMEESPGMSLADQLEAAKEALMARYPKKFGIAEQPAPQTPAPRRPAGQMTPSSANAAGLRPNAKAGFEAIDDPLERASAKAGFDQVRRSMPDITVSEYLQIFNDPHADVLRVIDDAKKPAKRN